MSLPLTLAVLDGMVVAVGKEKFIISLTAIIESLRPAKTELHKLSNGAEVVSLRGEYIRLVKLHRLFNIPGAQNDPSQALVVVGDRRSSGKSGDHPHHMGGVTVGKL